MGPCDLVTAEETPECWADIGGNCILVVGDKKVNNYLDTFLQSLSRLNPRVGDLDAKKDLNSFEQVLRWLRRVLTAF